MKPGFEDQLRKLREGGIGSREVVERYAPRLVRFFQCMGVDFRSAEDLTQEVFLKLIRRDWKYVERGSFDGYLFRIGYRLWIDRKRRNELPSVPFEEASSGEIRKGVRGSPVEILGDFEEEQKLHGALSKLPWEQRVAFELSVVEGMKYREVARILDIPLGTVKSRMFLAVEKLKSILAPARKRKVL